jgi:hypothetical protein
MIITIASPDKVSIAMFTSLMKHCLGNDLFIGEAHSLMTPEAIKLYLTDIKTKAEKILITYYARKKINVDPIKALPENLLNESNLLVWINLYSTDWVIVKDPENIAGFYNERWKKTVDRLNAQSLND